MHVAHASRRHPQMMAPRGVRGDLSESTRATLPPPREAAQAQLAVVVERGMRISRNDPIRGCVGRQGQQGRCLRGTAWPLVLAGETSGFAQRPYTRLCRSAGPAWSGRRGSGWPAVVVYRGMWFSRNDPIRGWVGRQGQQGRAGTGQRGRCSWRGATSGFAQRPYTRLCGPAAPAGSGPVCDSVAGGGGGSRNADFAQRPYTRLGGSAAPAGSGPARDGAAGGRGGSRNADFAQRPYTRLCGSAGSGPARSRRGRWSWRVAECGLRATTLYAAAWAGWAGRGLRGQRGRWS